MDIALKCCYYTKTLIGRDIRNIRSCRTAVCFVNAWQDACR